MDIHLNSEPVKYAIIALSFPLWMPFAKALWSELNASLRDEGGLFGAPPTPAELRALERERGRFRSSMINVTWAEQERLDAGGLPATDSGEAPLTTRSATATRTTGFRAR